MFKVLGLSGFGGFLVLSALLVQCAPGIGFMVLVALTVGIGSGSLYFLTVPEDSGGIGKAFARSSELDAGELVSKMEEVSGVIRQDGILALEAKRKELKDSNLGYLLKKIMDGFEAKELVPWIQNRKNAEFESTRTLMESLERFTAFLPGIGLVSSLILMIGVLSGSGRSQDRIGVADSFIPFLIMLGVQLLIESELGKRSSRIRRREEQYFEVLEIGITGIQSGVNPELLSDRMRARIRTGRTWAAK